MLRSLDQEVSDTEGLSSVMFENTKLTKTPSPHQNKGKPLCVCVPSYRESTVQTGLTLAVV